MKLLDYKENRQRGSEEFPFDFHHFDPTSLHYINTYHWHNELELMRVIDGELKVSIDDTEYVGHAGDFFIINGGALHSTTPNNCVYECLVFEFDKFFRTSQIIQTQLADYFNGKYQILPQVPPEDEEALRLFEELFQAFSEPTPESPLKVSGILFLLASIFKARGYYLPVADDSLPSLQRTNAIKQVFQYIAQNYDHAITLENLAEQAGMSPKYFCRYFKALTDRTPIDYLNYYRIESACEKLTMTKESITEIALDCGFNDLNYFIRCFKKYKGISPGKYLATSGRMPGIE